MKIDNKVVIFLLITIIVILGIIVLVDNVDNDIEDSSENNVQKRESPEERGYIDLDEDSEKDIEKSKIDDEPVDDFRKSFMDGCIEEGGANEEYCSCAYDYLESEMTKKEIAKMALEYEQTGEMPEVMVNAGIECIDKY